LAVKDLKEVIVGGRPVLILSAAKDLELASGSQCTAQLARASVQMIRGEWFLDRTLGLPLFDEEMTRGKNLPIAKAHYRSAIEQTPGVTALKSLEINPKGSRVEVVFEAITDTGEQINNNGVNGG